MGAVHIRLAWWAARRTVDTRQSVLVLATFPVRVAVISAAIAALAFVGPLCLASGLASLAVTERVLRKRATGEPT